MAKVEKKVKRSYKLELSESEYHALLCLLGGISYDEFKDYVNRRYSVRLGREEPEDFEILDYEGYSKFYCKLDDNK